LTIVSLLCLTMVRCIIYYLDDGGGHRLSFNITNIMHMTTSVSRRLNDHGYVPLVVNTSRSFPHSRLITGFVTRLIRWVPLVEQELLILPEHLSSPPVFSGVHVTRSLALYVCFEDRCLSFCSFSFGHCVVCFSSIYVF